MILLNWWSLHIKSFLLLLFNFSCSSCLSLCLRVTRENLKPAPNRDTWQKKEDEKMLGVGSGLTGALQQSLNQPVERERSTGRRRTEPHRLLLDCLLNSDQAAAHTTAPLPYTLLPFEKWASISINPQRAPPRPHLYATLVSSSTGPGALCYLVTGCGMTGLHHLEPPTGCYY